MIIGIDETGDFSPDSQNLSFYVAVLLEQHNNGIEIKRQQLEEWKKTIPQEKYNNKNEIKGSELTDEELLSFVKTVYIAKPHIKQEVVSFDPRENPESLMKEFKAKEVENLLAVAKSAQDNGDHKVAKIYENMAIWHKNATKMHYPHFFKLILLRCLISNAFNTAVGVSILYEMIEDKESLNLLNIEFKIDKDFIRGYDSNLFWKILLRHAFILSTETKPTPLLKTWSPDHPFLKKYRFEDTEHLNFREIFYKKCNFSESHETFEVQLADLTAIIINRFHNRSRAVDAFNLMYSDVKKKNYTQIILNDKMLS